ncbi:MAG TPA: hypothetical protein VGC42_28265 [Kofleriaceae bacterium]
MRVTSTVVVLSSLVVAAKVSADPAKPTAKKPPAATVSGSAKAGAASPAPTTPVSNAGGTSTGPTSGAPPAAATEPPVDVAAVKPEDMPTAVRMRRLEQKTQALKERAWQLKARVQMLKEQVLGGGAGAQAVIEHVSDMGASFRLTKLIYTLDGTQVFVRSDDTGETLYKTKSFDVFSGPIAPGNHNVAVIATYRGHGYGVFEYLSKYTFTAKGSQGFLAGEGKVNKVDCRGFEKGNATMPLEKRAAIECKASQVQPERPAEAASSAVPASVSGSATISSPTPSASPTPAASTAPTTPPPPVKPVK